MAKPQWNRAYWRKFRSQTSDTMDRWKSRGGKSQRREEQKREDQGRESVRRKKMQVRKKVAKSRNTLFFHRFVAPESRKVGSLKRRVRSHVAKWEMNNCTPLWREAHFEVKMYKTHHARTTFGSWDVEKVHAVVARSTFPSQNVQNTPFSDHLWKLRCRKSARRRSTFGSQNVQDTTSLEALLQVEMSKKCTPLWREAHLQVKSVKHWASRTTFGRSDVVWCGRCKGLCALSKLRGKNGRGFVAFPKTMAGVGHLKRIWKDAFRVAGAVQETCSSEIFGSLGTDFLRGVASWSIRSSGLLRWFCVTGAALRMTWHHFFMAGKILWTD